MLIFFRVSAKNWDIKLSDEHTNYKWISKKELDQMIKNKEIRNNGIKVALEKVLI